ncbi:hypothetical protein ABZZ80_47815, partial [Streptomyces sp. NPDC006356]
VFGGIAQTWEHVAHLYLRKVLVGATLLATTADLLPALALPTEPDPAIPAGAEADDPTTALAAPEVTR